MFPKHRACVTTAFPWPSSEAEQRWDAEGNRDILHQMKGLVPSLGRGRAKRDQGDSGSFLPQDECRESNCPLLNINPIMATGSADPCLLFHLKTMIYSQLPQGLCDPGLINTHQERILHFIISSLFYFYTPSIKTVSNYSHCWPWHLLLDLQR